MTEVDVSGGRERAPGPDAETARHRRVDADEPRDVSTEETPEGSVPRRFRWSAKHYSPAELAEARQTWRDAMPWEHPMSRGDKALVGATLGVLLLTVASMPVRPFLLASHPVVLSAVTGSLSAIGAGAAFARIGDGAVWLVVAAGVFGIVKFDWLFWMAGRQWGSKIIEMWAPGEGAKRFVARVRSWPRWALPLVVVAAALPGIPAPAVYAVAGLGRMRLTTFLIFDAIGAAIVAGLVAVLGFGVGQNAVDVVLTIDEYALWITLALVTAVTTKSVRRGIQEDRAKKARRRATRETPTGA